MFFKKKSGPKAQVLLALPCLALPWGQACIEDQDFINRLCRFENYRITILLNWFIFITIIMEASLAWTFWAGSYFFFLSQNYPFNWLKKLSPQICSPLDIFFSFSHPKVDYRLIFNSSFFLDFIETMEKEKTDYKDVFGNSGKKEKSWTFLAHLNDWNRIFFKTNQDHQPRDQKFCLSYIDWFVFIKILLCYGKNESWFPIGNFFSLSAGSRKRKNSHFTLL